MRQAGCLDNAAVAVGSSCEGGGGCGSVGISLRWQLPAAAAGEARELSVPLCDERPD